MSEAYLGDEIFEDIDFREKTLALGEYEQCEFRTCSFQEVPLSGCTFVACVFEDCDLSMAPLKNTALQNCRFLRCKAMGLRFEAVNPFLLELYFEECTLNFSSFSGLDLKNIHFKDCQLHEVDFSGTDLSYAYFENCDLYRAIFQQTILEKADFRSAYRFSIDPEVNKIRQAKFSKEDLAGLLEKYELAIE